MASPGIAEPRTVSGYLRDSQLRRQLEDKVKETTRTRQAAEEGVKAAQDLIDQARRIDANVVEAEKALAEANGTLTQEMLRKVLPLDQQLNYFARGNILEILMRSVHGAQIRMAEALSRLPPDYREVVVLRHFEELTFPEVARRMHRSEDSGE